MISANGRVNLFTFLLLMVCKFMIMVGLFMQATYSHI